MGIGKINIAALGPKLLRYLIPTMIGLVSTQLVLMPFIFKKIYTQRPRSDERIVSYDRGELNFGTEFEFTQNGDIQLELFDAEYPSVTSRDGDKVVAPGTDGHDTVQFTNNVHGEISYTAVLYMIRDSEDLPVKAELMGVNFDDTDKYSLPDGVDQSQVIRAVSGKLSPDEVVMVGNDAYEDTCAAALGIPVFLLTHSLVNRKGVDLSEIPHGDFDDLAAWIRAIGKMEKR